jgi:hypothetical protein
MRFAVARLEDGRASSSTLRAAAGLLQRAAGKVDELLFGPLVTWLDGVGSDAPVVVVPTGSLHSLPWGLVPSLATRAFTVVPSTTLWLRSGSPTGPGEHEAVVLVAGPELPGARREVEAIAQQYDDPTVLVGRQATVANVTRAMRGAGVVHVAAHGTFRTDNPLFSSLTLEDGPLTAYDLEMLDAHPKLVVLSSCDAGRADVRVGDELVGASAALLAMGVSAVVASLAPVSDATTPEVMAVFHSFLGAHQTAPVALASLRRKHCLADVASADLAARGAEAMSALTAGVWSCFGPGRRVGHSHRPAMRGSQLTVSITK